MARIVGKRRKDDEDGTAPSGSPLARTNRESSPELIESSIDSQLLTLQLN